MNSWPATSVAPLTIELAPLQLFDTKSGAVRALPNKAEYRIYVCGITPYDATHLGHAATYLTFDLIHRYLIGRGASVHFTENATDVDDPLLERAQRDGVDWQELAHQQIELFFSDMVALHVLPPQKYIGVVESIPIIARAIEEIQARGGAYLVDNDLYCEIERDPAFGSRSHLDRAAALTLFAERGGDPTRTGKRSPFDPLLWRASREGEPSWRSSVGDGRPGWHIECQAIALEYLGQNSDGTLIDIQGGGSDLIFPHHEMSASQTFIQTGREFADFYVHSGMIGLDGEKMSKSRGNLVFVSKLIASGVDPMAIRIALLSSHFQSDRMWSDQLLQGGQSLLAQLRAALSKNECAPTHVVVREIADDLSRNLDTPAALKRLGEWSKRTLDGDVGGDAGELSRAIDSLLGIAL